jgi:biotin transport system substrate-specific component
MTETNATAAPQRAIQQSRTRELVVAALIAALLAASAWVAIPLPFSAVPLTLQVFVVVLAALVLRPQVATLAVAAYLVLGTVGVPVFSGGKGGPGVIAGPTGGFLLGFMVAALVGALVRRGARATWSAPLADALGAATVIGVTYLLGWTQLMVVTGMTPIAAATAGVIPFIAFDIIKAGVAVGVAGALRRAGAV